MSPSSRPPGPILPPPYVADPITLPPPPISASWRAILETAVDTVRPANGAPS